MNSSPTDGQLSLVALILRLRKEGVSYRAISGSLSEAGVYDPTRHTVQSHAGPLNRGEKQQTLLTTQEDSM